MPVYLLHGDTKSTDPYQIRQRLDALLKGIKREGNLNFMEYDLSDSTTSFPDIVASALTIPFLGGQRVVVVRNIKAIEKKFEKQDEGEETPEEDLRGAADAIVRAVGQLSECPENSLVILVEENGHLDGRTAFWRALKNKEIGCVFESFKAMWFDPASGDIGNAVNFIQTEASRHGIRLDSHAAERFAILVGSDKGSILKELEKLAVYCGSGASPTIEDVENVVTPCYEAGIFHLVDAIGFGRTTEALEVLSDLLDRGAPVPVILAMIARQIRLIARVREETARGASRNHESLAKLLKENPFVIRKILIQSNQFPKFNYAKVLDWLMETDVHLKRGTMPGKPPGKLALELFITRLAGLAVDAGAMDHRPSRRRV